ncbi:DUF1580 domain-containing protein [Gemmata sp. G18]|uniref:DUF1580 domain-containing protein n=1 Tax=Gemmata palustris TaxID=2822762 RepID=A0ABS5BT02_9BACT|nr:DUF1580 domain-containing protein [Gemmata palustris]MBP3956853.1 DUF1580 domain-containing protein [Gemmata palustris]
MADVILGPDAAPQVLTEIQAGDGLSLARAGRLFPGHRGGVAVDPSTVFRWVTAGARGTNGDRVKLEAVRVGGRWLTSHAAVARFVTVLTAVSEQPVAVPPSVTRSSNTRRKTAERAAEKLKQMGA